MLLFIVKERFMIEGRGLVLTPGYGKNFARIGSKIKLIRPDKTVLETQIKGVEFAENFPILIEPSISKDQVPPGTEVWLAE